MNTASVAGLLGLAGRSAYVASKHGVVGITRTAALEYAPSGMRVNCVCPGYIHTPMVAYVMQHEGCQCDHRHTREVMPITARHTGDRVCFLVMRYTVKIRREGGRGCIR